MTVRVMTTVLSAPVAAPPGKVCDLTPAAVKRLSFHRTGNSLSQTVLSASAVTLGWTVRVTVRTLSQPASLVRCWV